MHKYLIFAAVAASLSACGGGTGVEEPALGFAPSSSTGFATAADIIDTAPSGTVLTVPVKRSARVQGQPFSVTDETATITVLENGLIRVKANGIDYDLQYDWNYQDYYSIEGAREIISDTVPIGRYGTFTRTVLYNYDNFGNLSDTEMLLGYTGFATNPANLPATATYAGTGLVSVIDSYGNYDDAFGQAQLNANFTGGTISGSMNLVDDNFDGPNGIELTSFTATIGNGTITGNTFQAPVHINPNDIGTVSAPQLTMDGGFFGPSGEEAGGIALAPATSVSGSFADDVRVLVDFEGVR